MDSGALSDCRGNVSWTHEPAHSENIERYTPSYFFDHLPVSFDLDPCSPVDPKKRTTKARQHFTKEDDGLSQPWFGTVFLNPPYHRKIVNQWIQKLAEHGDGIALLFARTDNAWFHDFTPDAIFFLKGRVNFISSVDLRPIEGGGAGAGSMLMAYGRICVSALEKTTLEGKLFHFGRTQGHHVRSTYLQPMLGLEVTP